MEDSILPDDIHRKPNPGNVLIYVLIDPRTNAIRYVGKTKCSLQKRLREHLYKPRDHNPHKAAWLAQLRELGLTPIIRAIEEVSSDNWEAREMFWIAHFQEMGCKLINVTRGGEGGGVTDPEVLARLAQARRGQKRSPETKARMSAANRGRKLSPEVRAQMSLSRRGRKMSPEAIANSAAGHRGLKRTPETRARMSEAARRREATQRRPPESAETRQKKAEAIRGKKRSPETRARMSEAAQRREARKRKSSDDPTLWD